ncbi:MAG: ABC transporter substrate-binding protein [Rikenellaceae bacterium]|nr:ABC transporter substrate-binding protein [Rikenellaceae bacterium]
MRKLFSIFIVATALLFVVTSCNRDEKRKSILKVYNWADYIDEDLLGEFEEWYKEQTGEDIEIVYQLFDINETMLAKIERGKEDFDVACPSEYIIERMLKNDLLLPINKDFGDTPNYLGNVSPYIHDVFDQIDGNGKNANDYAVGYMWGTTGFLYNKRYVERSEVDSWSALWDSKFKGKLFVKDAFRDVYSPLLIYANQDRIKRGEVSMSELMHDSSDESIAVVENLLKKAKPNVAGWEADFGKEMMTKEKAILNLTWSGDAVWAIEEAAEVGVELDYIVPKEGSIVWFDGWVIPKYAKNVKAASYFINFMCKSENAIRNMEEIGYVSVIGTKEVMDYMSESAVEAGLEEPLDLTYFFGDEADSVVIDPVLYADKAVIDRCAMMHDSGPRTSALLEMWSRVKGDNLNNAMVIFILFVFGCLSIAGIMRKIKRRRQRTRRW